MIDISSLNFEKLDGLVPCIVQDANSGKVLMLGFMNKEAVMKTLELQQVTFYSRTKERLWTKGETSGNTLTLVEMKVDCDQDTILVKALPTGPVCHTGNDTCFDEVNHSFSLESLQAVIQERIKNPKKGSYTAQLMNEGINKIAQKVGEEAVELVIESKDEDKEKFLNEAADLMYHYLLLLAAKGHSIEDVVTVLQQRHQKSK